MRKLLLLIFTLIGCFTIPASAAVEEAMVVETQGGNKVVFFFSTKPEMTFAGENVEIKSSSETVLYPMADVIQVRFEMQPSSIGEIESGDVIFRFTNGQLEVEGLQPATAIAVYSTDGAMVLKGKADEVGKVIIDMSSLNKGMYIVKANKVSYKLVKK